jgi:hypothetical protein
MLLNYLVEILGLSIPENSEFIVVYSFNVFILLLILFLSIINVLGYLISIIIIQRYDVKKKFPSFTRIIHFYEKRTLFFFLFDLFLVLSIILFLLAYSYYKFFEYLN